MVPWPGGVFCDTSFFFASLDGSDAHHRDALRWLERSARAQTIYWSTWDVVGETVTLLRRRLGHRAALSFIDRVLPGLRLVPCDDSTRREALAVFRRFGKDKDLSYCDCLSYVVLTVVLKPLMPAATFDRHFLMLGLPVLS